MLWPDQPFAERFGRAARAGFRAVELWWPGEAAAAALPGLLSRWDLRLVLLNFDGDLAAGERGLAADPRRRGQLRANVPVALEIARACGCERLNLLIGKRREEYSLSEQLACAKQNVAWTAVQAPPPNALTPARAPAGSGPAGPRGGPGPGPPPVAHFRMFTFGPPNAATTSLSRRSAS